VTQAAADVYELVVEEVGSPKKRSFFARVWPGRAQTEPGGVIITVLQRSTRQEVFRHIDDGDADEGHVLADIQNDLNTMTASDFAETWV